MEGTRIPTGGSVAVADYRGAGRSRRRPGWFRLLGPILATSLLLLASYALALHVSLAFWGVLPVVAVAIIVTGLLNSLVDAPSTDFRRRLSTYAIVVAWVWRALVVYGFGLILFLATIRFFS
jgi:hypothetical protein